MAEHRGDRLGNPVTGVLMAFRAMDTLLEKVVVLLALIGVWSLAPRPCLGRTAGARQPRPNRTVSSPSSRGVLPPVGIVAASTSCGSGRTPGGAFQGATILAAMWLLAMMAGVTRRAAGRAGAGCGSCSSSGRRCFSPSASAASSSRSAFLAYPEGYAKPLIVIIEVAMMLSVARHAGPAAGRPAGTDDEAMSSTTLFGLCAAVLVGLGPVRPDRAVRIRCARSSPST